MPAATAAALSCVLTASVRSCGSRQACPACVRPVLGSVTPASAQPVDCAGESLPAAPVAATQPARTAGSSCSSSTAPVALQTWAPWSGPLELSAAGVRHPCACPATSGELGRVRMLCVSSCVCVCVQPSCAMHAQPPVLPASWLSSCVPVEAQHTRTHKLPYPVCLHTCAQGPRLFAP